MRWLRRPGLAGAPSVPLQAQVRPMAWWPVLPHSRENGGILMRYETKTVRIGEDVGPIDWEHPLAKDMPEIWREADESPGHFTFSEYRRTILRICMYDRWPYWKPTPAICFVG